MMKFFGAFFIFLLTSSIVLADAQLANPGFEAMTTNPESNRLEPDNWNRYSQSGATVYYAGKTDVVHTGIYSYKIAARQGYGMTYQEVTSGFSEGETYSFWMYGRGDTNSTWQMDEPGDQVDVYVKFKDSLGTQIGQEVSMILFDADTLTDAPILDTNTWLKSPVFQFTLPEGTASFLIKIRSVDGTIDGNNADGTSVYMDDLTLDILPLPAKNPSPGNDDIEQSATDLLLNWEPGDDPYFQGVPNTDVTGYYIYVDYYDIANDPGEPNYPGITPIEVSSTTYPETGPGLNLGYDKIVYWRVDESINGSSIDSPSTVKGNLWTFNTESSFPEIVTQPQDVTVFESQQASITIEAVSTANPITFYEWYNANDEIVAYGASLDSLVFASVSIEDTGNYYCVVTNSQGKQAQSESANLYVKGLLAQYRFDNTLSDDTGRYDGIPKNIDPNIPGIISYDSAGIDGSAAVLNGQNFSQTGIDAFPNSYMGIDKGTLSCWIKKDNNETGTIIAAYNDDLTTAYNLSLQSSDRIYFYIRAESGAFTSIQVNIPGIFDGNWHHIALTYETGSNTIAYYDGEHIDSSAGISIGEEFAGWEYPMVIGAGNTRGTISNPYTGNLDNLLLFNYPMTNKEILDIYNYLSPAEKSLCLNTYASTYDLAGPDGIGAEYSDCKVDLYDFAAMAGAWLDCGLYPACNN